MVIDIKNNPRELRFDDLNKGEAFYDEDGKLCMKIDTLELWEDGFVNAVSLESGTTFYLSVGSIVERADVKIVRT